MIPVSTLYDEYIDYGTIIVDSFIRGGNKLSTWPSLNQRFEILYMPYCIKWVKLKF